MKLMLLVLALMVLGTNQSCRSNSGDAILWMD